MSSIRPLATITLLALVGVFLYMKINETGPQLPADIANWTMPSELEIGTSPAPGGLTESANPSPPATSTAPSYSAPPTMSTAPPASTAPTFNSSPPADSPQPTASADAPPLEVPDLPPLPTIPPARDTSATAEASPPAQASPPAEASPSAEMTPPVVAAPPAETAAPADMTSVASGAQAQSSLLSTTRLAVQAALDRGELSQALLLLSDWYGDPSLSPAETLEVNALLSQLAGSVIYSTQHRLEPPYMVQAGEQLSDIAQKCNVPWQLLAKINGLDGPDRLQPGQQLKVVRGPFSALIDLSERRMTLMLDRRYAGQFPLEVDPTTSVEEGTWTINQKLLTPGGVSPVSFSSASSDQKSLMMTNASGGTSQIVILRGSNTSTPAATDPAGRVLRLKSKDVDDVYDILSLGSSVTIRR